MMNIDDLSFRHLKLLDAIYRKRSLTDAARLLDMPQATASHSLARLRKAFNDELLVRVRGGMEPTQRLVAVADNIAHMLELKRMIADGGGDFSAARLDREFSIACSDVGQLLIGTYLYPLAAAEAPGARFRVVTMHMDEMIDALECGDIDLALGAFPGLSAGVNVQSLYTERYCCFARPGHPFIQSGRIDDFRASQHVIVSTKGMAHSHRVAEHALAEFLGDHHSHLSVASFLVAIVSAAQLGLIVTAPSLVIDRFASHNGLVGAAPPFDIADFHVSQYWHARESADPAHQWLRQSLFSACRPLRD